MFWLPKFEVVVVSWEDDQGKVCGFCKVQVAKMVLHLATAGNGVLGAVEIP